MGFGRVILTRVEFISRYHFKCENVQREIRSEAPSRIYRLWKFHLGIRLISQQLELILPSTPRPKLNMDQLYVSRALVFLLIIITVQITLLLRLLPYKLNRLLLDVRFGS